MCRMSSNCTTPVQNPTTAQLKARRSRQRRYTICPRQPGSVSHARHTRQLVRMAVLLFTAARLCASPPGAAAQSASDPPPLLAAAEPSRSISLHVDAPPEPVAPEVITRDAEGRATVRAVRVGQPLRIDGALDEALYRDVRSISDFIQVEPEGGQPATERTEAWVAFDDDYVYVSFKVWDSHMDDPDRDRDAARQPQQLAGQRPRLVHLRHVLRPAKRVHVHDEPARRPIRRHDGQRSAVQQRLESGVGDEGRPVRRRLDGRSGGAVQVAALSTRDGAGVGVQRDAREALEERDLHADAGAAGARTVGIPAVAVRGRARRDRGPARRREPGSSNRTRSRA